MGCPPGGGRLSKSFGYPALCEMFAEAIPTAILFVLVGAVVSAATARVVVRVAARVGLVDHPNARSSHNVPTPRGGGLGIVLPTLLAATVLFWFEGTNSAWPAFAGATFVAAVGFIDDLRGLPPGVRLALQLGSASATVALCDVGGFFADYRSRIAIEIASVIWITGMVNAYNFMDGIDGLAGAQAAITGIVLAFFAASEACHPGAVQLAFVLAGAAAGFTVLNWAPAVVFMGDVGSGFLGFLFAVWPLILLKSCGPTAAVRGLVIIVGALSPFLCDTAFTMFRRALSGENLMTAHRSHVYQRLVAAGLSHAQVSMLYLVLAANGATMAVGATIRELNVIFAAVEPLLVFVAVCIWVRALEKQSARIGVKGCKM